MHYCALKVMFAELHKGKFVRWLPVGIVPVSANPICAGSRPQGQLLVDRLSPMCRITESRYQRAKSNDSSQSDPNVYGHVHPGRCTVHIGSLRVEFEIFLIVSGRLGFPAVFGFSA